MKIKINIKRMGKRKQSIEPVAYEIAQCPSTVRQLILEVTKAGVSEYNKRLKQPEILACLTREEIEDKAQGGKISFGVIYGEKEADLQAAMDNAIQCFEDSIYRIFLDNEPLEDLDKQITITEESVLTFVRLTMLTGRLW